MINISQLNEIQVLAFGLILLRMTAFVMSSAIFSSPTISVAVKVLFSVVLTILVFKPVATNMVIARLSENESQLILMAGTELLIGLVLGFFTRIFFFALSMAGEIVSVSTGLGQAQLFNPMLGSMGNAMEQFYVTVGTLLFFALNGHHMMIQGLVQSFTTSELAMAQFNIQSFAEVVMRTQEFFILGIKISAPILISMIIVQVGIALLSRAVPQINVLVTSVSIATLLGFGIIFISLPLLVMEMSGLLDLTAVEFFKFMKTL
ncbi:MAG: flagellar biosynthetic protein FliR [Bdellovibrionales bacterium RIFCSPHIGHO2_01_FULL_40_29]|nr:MAG: flagellar biosynthetic protein FliR [Bdellovibrionales bacterium RIFCSPHIGHO2_01_FULL_40_29]OFZ32830.1 MAG: flagellar biosynthetic protein FliR [Bdellovibrionales bacterium RIFCSPHIGHO2_02_FULL_40_15]